MVAVRMRDKDVRHGLAAHGIEQRRDVHGIVGPRIDDRDFAAPDDVADRPLEGERPRVVGDDAAHAGRDLLGAARLQLKSPVVRDVVAMRDLCPFTRCVPADRNGLVKSRLDTAAQICKASSQREYGRKR